jgi:hypothetical protein
MHRALRITATTIGMAIPAAVLAAPPLPNEFDDPAHALDPLFAYFGGVVNWGTNPSGTTIHSGDSLEVWALLVDDIFNVAGFAVGTFGTTPPALDVPAGADTFSMTIEAPSEGQLSFAVTLREDDNGDGLIDANNFDDQWESPTILLEPGIHVYNIPLSMFADADADVGNNVQNFDTTTRVAYMLTFETRDAYPGGRIVGPVSFLIDHVGLYDGPQELPGPSAPTPAFGARPRFPAGTTP